MPESTGGTTVSWGAMVPSFLKKDRNGRNQLQKLLSGMTREERIADNLREQVFGVFPEYRPSERKELSEALEQVTDQQKLSSLVGVAQKLKADMEDFPREGFLALLKNNDGAIADVVANLDHITERYNNLNRIIGIRSDLMSQYGVLPDENGLIPTLQAHNEVRRYLLESPFYRRKIHYLGTREVVEKIQESPEEMHRVMDYFKARARVPKGNESMYDLPFTFDPEHFNQYFNTHDALDGGVL